MDKYILIKDIPVWSETPLKQLEKLEREEREENCNRIL